MATSWRIEAADRTPGPPKGPISQYAERGEEILAMPPLPAGVEEARRRLAALVVKLVADSLGRRDEYRDAVEALGLGDFRVRDYAPAPGGKARCACCRQPWDPSDMVPSHAFPGGRRYWCRTCRDRVVAEAFPETSGGSAR